MNIITKKNLTHQTPCDRSDMQSLLQLQRRQRRLSIYVKNGAFVFPYLNGILLELRSWKLFRMLKSLSFIYAETKNEKPRGSKFQIAI